MRLVLLYPPSGKISRPREPQEGCPADAPDRDPGLIEDGDFLTAPYGLLSLAAQAKRAGHDVQVFNLANFPWFDLEVLIRNSEADLFGLSCHHGNRYGVAMVSQLIRQVYPRAHIVSGGPQVTALPEETLKHFQAIDTIVIGEGEATFLELLRRLETGQGPAGLAGSAWRRGEEIQLGPPRPRLQDLDELVSPVDYFPIRTLVTSRGCPGECTFCGSKGMWGRRVTFHSADYVLDMLETSVTRHGQKYIAFKDDTFTTNRTRALSICQGILARKLNLIWSCDTRVDRLDEELLYCMRMAGCQRISLGVESGSPGILKNIKKHISPDEVWKATRLAQKYGLWVRFYMMTGNRGETPETTRETRAFIEKARPNEVTTCPLSIYPGTEEFEILRAKGTSPAIFFNRDKLSLAKDAPGAPEPKTDPSREKMAEPNVTLYADYSVAELLQVLERLPNHAGAQMDLAGAYCRSGEYDKAEEHLRSALELGFPCPGLAFNYLACIAAGRQDSAAVMGYLFKALRVFPHAVVLQNLERFHAWLKEGGLDSGQPLTLLAHNRFESNFIPRQPVTPGPIVLKDRQGETCHLGPQDTRETCTSAFLAPLAAGH